MPKPDCLLALSGKKGIKKNVLQTQTRINTDIFRY
jgi:hypothetical protein